MKHISDEYYPIFKIWTFFMPKVIIRHPNDLKVTKYKRNLILLLLLINQQFNLYIYCSFLFFKNINFLKYFYLWTICKR